MYCEPFLLHPIDSPLCVGSIMFTRLAYPLALSWFLPHVQAQFILFVDGTQAILDISQGCTTALNATINCDPYLQQLVSDDYYGSLNNATLQNSVCAASCGTSLKSYHTAVATACANDPQPWDGVPAVWAGDVIWAAYNQTCLKDPTTGAYCVGSYLFMTYIFYLSFLSKLTLIC